MPVEVTNLRADAAATTGTRTVKMLAVGPPGVGKTLSASTWPNVVYADLEGGMLSVRNRDVRRARILQVAHLEELKAMLGQRPQVRAEMLGGPVDTVCIDTVDELARMIIRERLRAEKQETMRMNDWGYLGDTLRNLLRAFRNLDDLNVIFNCHLKATEDSESGRIEKKPDIQGSVGHEIAAYVDEAFLLVARPVLDSTTGDRTVKRYYQTYPDSQHDWVKDRSGTLPMEVPIDFQTDYERLAKYIFGDVVAATPAPVTAEVTMSTSETTDEDRAPAAKVPARRGRPPKVKPVTDVALPDPVPEPDIAPVPEKETEIPEPVEEPEAAPAVAGPVCAECGKVVDNPEVAELSDVRFGEVLCREHFVARRNRKA